MKKCIGAVWSMAAAGLFLVSFAQGASATEIIVMVDKKIDVKRPGKRPMCKLTFALTNNAFGTIYHFEAKISARDDRGRPVDSYGLARATNRQSYKKISIKKGETISGLRGATFKEECKFLTEFSIAEVKDENCSIRMHPENVSCRSIVKMDGGASPANGLLGDNDKPKGSVDVLDKPKRAIKPGIHSRLKKGQVYKHYSDNSCRSGRTEHCISLAEYKELCKRAEGFTRNVRTMAAVSYSGLFGKFIRNGGDFTSGGIRWSGKSCRASFTISGLFRGTMTRKVIRGRVSNFVYNSEGKLLVHWLNTMR